MDGVGKESEQIVVSGGGEAILRANQGTGLNVLKEI